MKPFHVQLCALSFIIGLGAIVYSNSFHNSFHMDDYPVLVNNPAIRDIHDLRAIWNCLPTRFITYYSFALNYRWGGLDVVGYHAFSLLLHLASAVMVWLSISMIVRSPHTPWTAFFTSLIFLTHPLQTQPVNYIVQRAVLLVSLFYLASLYLYVRSRLLQDNGSPLWLIFYIGSLFSAVLSMFSKEIAISLPLMICCYEFCFLKDTKGFSWKMVSPFLVLILIIPLVLLPIHPDSLNIMKKTVHDFSGGVGPMQYFLTQLRVKVTYLRLLFLPIGQRVEYDYGLSHSIFELPVFFSCLFLLGILLFAFKMINKFKLISFSIFWFFITLLPESSFWPNRDLVFEHRLYLPMVGFGLFVSAGLFHLFRANVKFAVGLLVLLVAVYSVLTYERNKIWHDEMSLWDDAVRQAPGKEISHLNRGAAFQNEGKLDWALADYTRAIEIDPNDAIAHSNLGLIYLDKGDDSRAIAEFDQAVRINGGFAGAFYNRARVYDRKGDLDRAIADYDQVIRINPYNTDAYNNRAAAYYKKGLLAQALDGYNRAIALDPKFMMAYVNKGKVYQDRKDFNRALESYGQALAIDPHASFAYYNRASLYQETGLLDKAIADYTKAIECDVSYAGAYNNRGVIYSLKGEWQQAFADYNKALAIDPHSTAARQNLEHLVKILNSK